MNGERLLQSLTRGNTPHAVLISGPAGSGRGALARRAAAVFCFGEDTPERLKNYPDYAELSGDGVSAEQMRDMVASANMQTFCGGGRAYVITDAHLMSLVVQNALLKTLEEPPEGTLIVLSGTEAGLLPTIRSRCMIERLGAVPLSEVRAALTARGVGAAEADTLAAFSDGIPGRAEAFCSEEGMALRTETLDALEQTLFGTPPFALVSAWTARSGGGEAEPKQQRAFRNARSALTVWESMLHDALRVSVDAPLFQNPDRVKLARRIATHFTSAQIEDMIDEAVCAQEMLYHRAIPQFALDALLSKMLVVRTGGGAR